MADQPYLLSGRLLGEGSITTTMPSAAESAVLASMFAEKDQAEIQRQAASEERLDIYEDDWAASLERRINRVFKARVNADDLVRVRDTTHNPLKRIVNEVSTLYQRPPVWTFKDKDTAALWRQVLKGADYVEYAPELNKMVTLLNTVLTYICPYRDRLTFRQILPQDAHVVPDPNDPARPLAVMFREGNAHNPRGVPTWHVWDRRGAVTTHQQFDVQGRAITKLLQIDAYRDEFGMPVIPIVAHHDHKPRRGFFWDDTSGDDLVELTIMVGLWETFMNHLIRTDSFKQKYATGLLQAMEEQIGGTLNMIQLRSPDGTPVNVGEFSSQADWDGLGNQIRRKYENVLNSYGLVLADNRTSGDPTSGFALQVRKEGLIARRESQATTYRRWDLSLYEVVAAVWNAESQNPASQIPEGGLLAPPSIAQPEIQYAMLHTPQTVEEEDKRFELKKKRMAMGLESPLTIYLAEHPGESEEDAKAAIEKNKADTKALAPEPTPSAPPGEGFNQSVPGKPATDPDPAASSNDEEDA